MSGQKEVLVDQLLVGKGMTSVTDVTEQDIGPGTVPMTDITGSGDQVVGVVVEVEDTDPHLPGEGEGLAPGLVTEGGAHVADHAVVKGTGQGQEAEKPVTKEEVPKRVNPEVNLGQRVKVGLNLVVDHQVEHQMKMLMAAPLIMKDHHLDHQVGAGLGVGQRDEDNSYLLCVHKLLQRSSSYCKVQSVNYRHCMRL